MSSPGIPSQTMARASAMIRGKRTGIVIDSSKVSADKDTGKVDMDALFEMAEQKTPAEEKKMSPKKKQPPRKVKSPRAVRMSLPGSEEENIDNGSEVKKYVSKLRSRGKNGLSYSPSELSEVSTLAPTPADDKLLTQPAEVLPQAAERVTSPEADFPVADNEVDDDDDLGPPALPPDEDEDGDKKLAAKTSLTDTESDGIDDDDEGAGYNMIHDPETPASARKRRALKEKEELKKKKKKKAKKSLKKRAVTFSPKGIPIANRDYNTIPLAELIEESPQDKSVRRSKRARVKPLQFWRNEKAEYGAHEESGVLGEAMGNMPVVKNIVKAQPTPYRKKKQPTANKKRRKAKSTDSVETVEVDEPFDTSRLRRKYKVVDGEIAHIWDDGADDSADLSTFDIVALRYFFTTASDLSSFALQRLFHTLPIWKQVTYQCQVPERKGKAKSLVKPHKPSMFLMTKMIIMLGILLGISYYLRKVSRMQNRLVRVRKPSLFVIVSLEH